jgi:hypothetical protein
MIVAAEPGKMRTIAQKNRRRVLRMLCCVVAEEFGAQAFLKSTSTGTKTRLFARRQRAQIETEKVLTSMLTAGAAGETIFVCNSPWSVCQRIRSAMVSSNSGQI